MRQSAGIDRVGYRCELETPSGPRVVEQQVNYAVEDDRTVLVRIRLLGIRIPGRGDEVLVRNEPNPPGLT